MNKFDRNYILTITELGKPDIQITWPTTLEFNVVRNTLSSANACQIRLFNLSLEHRDRLRQNQSDYGATFGYKQDIELRAGYGNNLAVIFRGNINYAFSQREGVNYITTLESFDAGLAQVNGYVDLEFSKGTPIKQVITEIANTLPDVTIGAIGLFIGALTKGASFTGNAMQILYELTGGGCYIDSGKFYALGTYEYVQSIDSVSEISSASGLLQTPQLERTIVTFDMIFEPKLNIGTQVTLNSSTETGFNGQYIVKGVKHRGVISGAICGVAITTGTFLAGEQNIGILPQ